MGRLVRRDLYACIAVALGASLVLLFLTPVFDINNFYVVSHEVMANDQVGYLTSARWLAETGELRSHLIFPSRVREPNWRLYMPGQYYVLSAGHLIFGDGPIAWRTPSFIAFVVSAVGIFVLGKSYYTLATGLVAAALFVGFPPITAFTFTAMPQLPFIAANVIAFCIFTLVPTRARAFAVPLVLALPFLFRETGAFLIIPMLIVMLGESRERPWRRVSAAALAAVVFLYALLAWQIATGKGSLPLDGRQFNYANAFRPEAPPMNLSVWIAGLVANVTRNLDVLARHAAQYDYVCVPAVILCAAAIVSLIRGVRGDRLALGSGLLFGCVTLVITMFYTWERYRGLRSVLFTVPFLAVSVAPVVSALLSRIRPKGFATVVVIGLSVLVYWGNVRMTRGFGGAEGARSVEVLENLNLDTSGVLISPVALSLDYVLRNYPLRWSYPPANAKTLELVAELYDVSTVIMREDDVGRRLTEQDLRNIGLVRAREFEHAVFNSRATFVVFEKAHRENEKR